MLPTLCRKAHDEVTTRLRTCGADSKKKKRIPVIKKPFCSSMVCFDLNPKYADETCGPTNARHKKDGASFLNPKLWYKQDWYNANRLKARTLVEKDKRVKKYIECAYIYVNKEIMESCDQRIVMNVIAGINNGYRGLELLQESRMACNQRYVKAVVKFTKQAKHGTTKSNDIDLCVYSEKFTYWDRVIANRMADADSISASLSQKK